MMGEVSGAHRTVQVRIEGRVQGVGYRMWVKQTAEELGLRGWVRNRHDGSVEALFSGPRDAVAAMLAACAEGPRGAAVNGVVVIVDGGYVPAAFDIRPTA